MKITAARARPDQFRMILPFKTANVVNEVVGLTHVVIETDAGLTGYGEAYPAFEVTGETQAATVDVLETYIFPALIGAEIDDLDSVRDLKQAYDPDAGPQIVAANPGAKAAVDMALLDLVGKGQGQALCRVLNPDAPEQLEVPLTGAVGIMDSVEGAVAVGRLQVDNGLQRLKVKVGLDDDHDLEIVAALKAALPETSLCLDANQGWVTWEGAARFFDRLGEGVVEYVEQPVLADDYLGLVELKRRFPIEIMADESVHTRGQAKTLIEMGAVDYLNLKLMKHGGLLNSLAICDLAADYGVSCQVGSMGENVIASAAGAHLYLSHPNLIHAELIGWWVFDRPGDKQLTAVEGRLVLPDAPGLGVDGGRLLASL
jgi:L-alanine-DL-glutamate epimerase-like enolase superfamily enzyme